MLRLISGEGLGMQQLTRNMSLQVTKTSVGARRGNWPLMDLYKTYDVSHVLIIIIITEGGHICLPLINNNLNTQKPQWTLSNFLCFQPELREKCVERAAFVGFPEVLAGTCKRATRFLFRRTAAQSYSSKYKRAQWRRSVWGVALLLSRFASKATLVYLPEYTHE